MITDIPTVILEEVAEVAALVAQKGVRVDWLDEALGRVATKKKHVELLERIRHVRMSWPSWISEGMRSSNFCLKQTPNLYIITLVIRGLQIIL